MEFEGIQRWRFTISNGTPTHASVLFSWRRSTDDNNNIRSMPGMNSQNRRMHFLAVQDTGIDTSPGVEVSHLETCPESGITPPPSRPALTPQMRGQCGGVGLPRLGINSFCASIFPISWQWAGDFTFNSRQICSLVRSSRKFVWFYLILLINNELLVLFAVIVGRSFGANPQYCIWSISTVLRCAHSTCFDLPQGPQLESPISSY